MPSDTIGEGSALRRRSRSLTTMKQECVAFPFRPDFGQGSANIDTGTETLFQAALFHFVFGCYNIIRIDTLKLKPYWFESFKTLKQKDLIMNDIHEGIAPRRYDRKDVTVIELTDMIPD